MKDERSNKKGGYCGMEKLGYDNNAIKRAALEQGLTQKEVARMAEVTSATIGAVFRGRKVLPSTMRKIAQALRLNLADLVVDIVHEGQETEAVTR